MTRDIVELVDREADLLMRGLKASSLLGTVTLLHQYRETYQMSDIMFLYLPTEHVQCIAAKRRRWHCCI